ncbi:hypothetical protein ID866_7302 [Astraeus odoratus]|nr:hypothetical protein ID866_7302 [Astraeus odoratus]
MSALRWLFLLMFMSFMAAKLWWYSHDLSWMKNTLFYGKALLPLNHKLVVFQLVTDFFADAILVGLPVRLLWGIRLPRRQRRMVLLIFSSSIIVTLAAIFRSTLQIMHKRNLVEIAINVEVGLATITLNLLVCVTFIYRYWRSKSLGNGDLDSDDSESDDDYTTPIRRSRTTQLTTTIELGTMLPSDYTVSTCQEGHSRQALGSAEMHGHTWVPSRSVHYTGISFHDLLEPCHSSLENVDSDGDGNEDDYTVPVQHIRTTQLMTMIELAPVHPLDQTVSTCLESHSSQALASSEIHRFSATEHGGTSRSVRCVAISSDVCVNYITYNFLMWRHRPFHSNVCHRRTYVKRLRGTRHWRLFLCSLVSSYYAQLYSGNIAWGIEMRRYQDLSMTVCPETPGVAPFQGCILVYLSACRL